MKRLIKHIIILLAILSSIAGISGYAQKPASKMSLNPRSQAAAQRRESARRHAESEEAAAMVGRTDTATGLKFPIKDNEVVTYDELQEQPAIDLKTPSNITSNVEYDPSTGYYIFHNRVGDMDISTPFVLSEDEYRSHALKQSMNEYWAEKAKTNTDDGNKFSLSEIKIGLGKKGENIFGPGGIQLKTQGSVDLDFGFTISKRDNPTISEKNRVNTIFDFDTKIQLAANGSVGDKINFNLNYNTEATFDADQSLINLSYKGDEDDIIQRVEAGNVSLPISSSLITGSTDLFGFRTDLQFGKLKISGVISQQESERKTISTEGAQTTKFELVPTEYEENRHFFLSTYFYDHYDEWAQNAPNPQSGIVINKVEVWVTNNSTSSANYTTRNIVALTELGEKYDEEGKSTDLPANASSDLYKILTSNEEIRDIQSASFALNSTSYNGKTLESASDYEILNSARMLNTSEYTLNANLGYISLKSTAASDHIVGVAYEYTKGGKTYRVGELTTTNTDTTSKSTKNLYIKLLKSSIPAPSNKKLWNMMMRNVYSLGAFNVQQDNFKVEVKYYYQSDSLTSYLTYIPALNKKNLLQVLKMDRLNKRQNAMPDGYFDFIEGYTVNSSTGRIIFLSARPFDTGIKNGYGKLSHIDDYTFPELYDSTLTIAKQYTEKNKYIITGEYSSSSGSEIRLGVTNIARGSVRVTAGGRTLTEGTGYTVDYNLGVVKILDETALVSNSPIQVSVESESFFNTQRKSLIGINGEYAFSDKFSLGATILHLNEKPLTQKVGLGNEPLSNTIWGMNGTYKTDWQWLTTAIDKLPLINAKAPSSFAISGEFAQLIPGHNRAVNQDDKSGVSYIDDFEGTESSINIKNPTSWALASTPKISSGPFFGKHFIRENDPFWSDKLTDNISINNIGYGLNRAHLAWYYIDQIFTSNSNSTPDHIKKDKDQLSNHYIRQVSEQEIYQDKDPIYGESSTLQTLHLHYYPQQRGPYNLDVSGMGDDGKLENPGDRWAGIMRKLDNTNFENSNIEYIELWLMDPFKYQDMNTTSGQLVFNLGSVSEDVLKDGRKAFENGLPTSQNNAAVDTTIWGRVPRLTAVTSSFDNSNLKQQDIGLDGLSDEEEKLFEASYKIYTDAIAKKVTTQTKLNWANGDDPFSPLNDPAGDNFHYYRGDDYDDNTCNVFKRYKYYNGLEGNSTSGDSKYTSTATTTPDGEDLNGDNTLNETEQYFEYVINIDKDNFEDTNNWEENFITNMVKYKASLKNGNEDTIKWYQLRIPIHTDKKRAEGSISDFRSIRFIRMYMTGFEEEEHLRFGELRLVRTDWRIYEKNEVLVEQSIANKLQNTGRIEISSVCIENDSRKKPVAYQLPPGIDRTIDPSQTQSTQENEQSMVLRIDSLESNDCRAVYKTMNLDTRQYKKFKMFIHAEKLIDGEDIPDNRLYAFIRMGSDFTENYYEYRIPLKITPEGALNTYSVWPETNNFDFEFETLTNLKLERDKRKSEGQVRYNERYTKQDGRNSMTVIGSPSFGEINSVMIGIVNEDDVPHSAEIWVNEMRMSGFNEDGGWAAVANMGIVFSDLGSLTLGGQIQTVGFGSIEDNVANRNQEDFYEYNLTAAIQLGKLFPEKAKVNMPFTYTRTHQMSSPKYDPMSTDVELKKTLDNYESDAIKDSIKQMSRTDKVYQSFALNNVRVGITSKKPMPYDPANFSFSLGYNETKETNPEVEYEINKNYKGTFNYVYSLNPKPVEPFKKVKWLKSNNLKLIKEFNFYYLPKNISFSTSMTRFYEEIQNRSYNSPIVKDTTFQYMSFDKNWTWDRTSNIKWDLTRALKLSFSSAMNSEIAEVIRTSEEDGNRLVNIPVNKQYLEDIGYYDWYDRWKDTVKSSIRNFGDPVSYEQKFNISYTIPINKLPQMDWITSNAQYSANYQWDKGTILTLGQAPTTGNMMNNYRSWSGDIRFNFETLYNKFPYLKEVNRKLGKTATAQASKKGEDKKADNKPKVYERKKLRLKAGSKTRINHRLNSTKLEVTLKDTSGASVPFKFSVIDQNSINITTKADFNNLTLTVNSKQKDDNVFDKIRDNTVRALMMIRNININYRHTDVLEVNGYKPYSGFLGQDHHNPGYDFTFGFYNVNNFLNRIYREDSLLITDESITSPIVHTKTQTLTVKSLLEPIAGLKIDVNASWYKNNQDDIYYMYGYDTDWKNQDIAGSFSRTCIAIRTAFKGNTANSKVFKKFLENRNIIQRRIYNEVGYQNANGKQNYVNRSSADVLIPAFYAAYMGRDASTTDLRTVPTGSLKSMLTSLIPNWKVTCDALMRIAGIKKVFKSFNLNHAYKSTYSVGPYQSLNNWANDIYGSDLYGTYNVNEDETSDFCYVSSRCDVKKVTISEQFSPLFGFDASLKNSLSFKFDVKKSRTAELDIPGNQILESNSMEYVIGTGYRFDDIGMIIKVGKSQKKVKNDLNLRGDVSYKNTDAYIRVIDEEYSQLSSGLRSFTLKFSADYVLSERLNIKLYYDCKSSTPKVSNGYPTVTNDFGIAFKINLTR